MICRSVTGLMNTSATRLIYWVGRFCIALYVELPLYLDNGRSQCREIL